MSRQTSPTLLAGCLTLTGALLQATFLHENMQPSVTSIYTPTSAPPSDFGATPHGMHGMSGPMTGIFAPLNSVHPGFPEAGAITLLVSMSDSACPCCIGSARRCALVAAGSAALRAQGLKRAFALCRDTRAEAAAQQCSAPQAGDPFVARR